MAHTCYQLELIVRLLLVLTLPRSVKSSNNNGRRLLFLPWRYQGFINQRINLIWHIAFCRHFNLTFVLENVSCFSKKFGLECPSSLLYDFSYVTDAIKIPIQYEPISVNGTYCVNK